MEQSTNYGFYLPSRDDKVDIDIISKNFITIDEQIKKNADNIDKNAGVKTSEGGEIFNDYENNEALSQYTHAEGMLNQSGVYGYKMIDITHGTQTETSTEIALITVRDKDLEVKAKDAYSAGDILNFDGNYHHYGKYAVINVELNADGNSVIVVAPIGQTSLYTGTTLSEADKTNTDTFDLYDEENWIWSETISGGESMKQSIGAHAEGFSNKTIGFAAHVEGNSNIALGAHSHAEGRETTAHYAAHAEGRGTKALGQMSHAEGRNTEALATYSHAEGYMSKASDTGAHAEGYDTAAAADYSHAEGYQTKAKGSYSHAEGYKATATAIYSHAEGRETIASGNSAHSEGWETIASGAQSHAEGHKTTASGTFAHTEGEDTAAYAYRSHAEGQASKVGHAGQTSEEAKAAHAEGYYTQAYGQYSHAEGSNTVTGKSGSTNTGKSAHAEGDSTHARSNYSHAEGYSTIAGTGSQGKGIAAHSEGHTTQATGNYSHAEGHETVASGVASHAAGTGTKATGANQTVVGAYNATDANSYFIVGFGTSNEDRKNALTVSKEDGHTEVQPGTTETSVLQKQQIDQSIKDYFNSRIFIGTEVDLKTKYPDGYPDGLIWVNTAVS